RNSNRIRMMTPRHESGVTLAAEAYGKLTGRPAVGLVSRGPGATNASIGVHVASQDSTPLILIIGHVPTHTKGQEAFQEIDYHLMFGKVAKAVLEPESSGQVAQITAKALALATSGRPGPVIIVMPKDITEGDAGDPTIPGPIPRAVSAPAPQAVDAAARLIDRAERPMVIAGEMVTNEGAQDALARFADASGVAVSAAYRRQDALANSHPGYAGHLEINRVAWQETAFAEADLIIAVGTRMDGITSLEFQLVRPDQAFIHIFPDPDVLARFPHTMALAADAGPTLAALADAVSAPKVDRLAWRDDLHQKYLDFVVPGEIKVKGDVDMAACVVEAQRQLDDDAVILTDSGTFARWVHRYYQFSTGRTQAGPMCGAMGYAVPGAIGAAAARPNAQIVAFVGDGGFQMTGQELMTAVAHDIPIKVIVADNQAWGSILVSQERRYGEEGIFGTRLASPDFAALARAYGMPGWRVEATSAFSPAFAEAMAHDGPALIHLVLDERDISPFAAEQAV
ncbi:MAG: thiamine pyrophosphate-dependent enzyme, partial [Alphaproteobacteria bacterium]